MKKETFADSASLNKSNSCTPKLDGERMRKYKAFSVAFSYPDDNFFKFFPKLLNKREKLISLYDRLFRREEIWLYTTEYLAENEFQRANALADIMGFYRAFKLEPDKKRPDSLETELEFMHYLIFKKIHVDRLGKGKDEKSFICLDAQKKFFNEHIYPGANKIVNKISLQMGSNFYSDTAKELLNFLKSEKRYLGKSLR